MKFYKKQFPNGLRLITVPDESKTVTVMALSETGSKYENKENNGISHFLEHMFFKGTEKRPRNIDISTELDGLGAQYNAFTSHEYTGYYAKGTTRHFQKLTDIISDIYLNSIFPEEEVEKEKGVILDEINMYEDLPMRKVWDLFFDLLYGDQPAGWTILGSKENIKKMNRSDFLEYKKKHYVAKGTLIVVSGGVTHKQAVKEVEEKFASIPTSPKSKKSKVKEEQNNPKLKLEYKKTDQTHIIAGFRTFGVKNKNTVTLDVLGGILGGGMSSRLFSRLRDQMGVGYYVRAGHEPLTDHGLLAASCGVDNKRAKEVTSVLLEEFETLKNEKVTPKELKKVKEQMIGNLYLGLETTDQTAGFFSEQEILKKEIMKPRELERKIKAVTPEDIQKLAKQILVPNRLNLVVLGPFKDEKPFKDILKK